MITIRKVLDGELLKGVEAPGFMDETVLLVPVGDMLVECGFRMMEVPSHVAPTEPARRATLDEVAEVAHVLACMAERRERRGA